MNASYAYIYDDFLADPRFQDALATLETRLASLGLSGHVGRLTLFRSAKELVEGFVAQGAKTIVAVGNDNTVNKLMWFLPDLPVVLGYLPLAEPSGMARLLNIPIGLDACSALSARLIETLDMGKINDRYFLTEAVFENTRAQLNVENSYKLSLASGGSIMIRNLGTMDKYNFQSDARDGLLEAVLIPQQKEDFGARFWRRMHKEPEHTQITFKQGEIVSDQPVEAHADRFSVSGFKFQLSIEPRKLKVITGRIMSLMSPKQQTEGEIRNPA